MNSVTSAPPDRKMLSTFFPHMLETFNSIGPEGTQFAYYTSAEVAASILRSNQFWMRNATTMNDYSEIEHGIGCLVRAKERGALEIFKNALDRAFPEISREPLNLFDLWLPGIRSGTYILSLSRHDVADQHGQLSMWRAYGGKSGVAIIVGGSILLSPQNQVAFYASPVMYKTPDEFSDYFLSVAKRMLDSTEYLRTFGRAQLKNIAFTMLRSAALCTKHPGFREENEWRVLASPDMYPSRLLRKEVECVRGTLQTVIKVDLKSDLDGGITGLDVGNLFERLIIGPCEHPELVAEALLNLLVQAGVSNPHERVSVSGIPLRHC